MIGHKKTNLRVAGGPSSSSVISNVQNLSIGSATFKVTQSQTVTPNPLDDPQNVLDWLSPINYRTIQNDTFSIHTPGTGSWFIEHPKFQGFLSGIIPVLCARGPPGVGKTILSSIVIRHLESSFLNNHDSIAIIFAYCRYTSRLSITDILSSFVKQLVERHPRVLRSVETVYREHLMDATRPTVQDWLELLETIIQSFKRVYIVIDALDEFPDNARDGLLNALISLKASLLITSRPSNAFHLLRDIEFIEVGDESGPGQDIEFFIDQRFKESSNLTNLLRRKEQARREICAKLKETSKSMFLVAALQLESLKDSTTVSQLRNAANSLSSDMDAVYSASWERIKAQSKPQASLAEAAMIWLTHTYRPLTIIELQHALAVSSDGEAFNTEDIADEDTIISVCCGLITIERESRIVRLVHFTALDFFRRLGHSLCRKPHTLLSTRCLSYLSASRFSPNKISTREELEVSLKDEAHPFRDYAYHHWGSHAGCCNEEGGMPIAVSDFLLHCEPYPCIIEGGKFDLFKRCHVSVYYGIQYKSVSNEWCNRLTLLTKSTPLILACGRGNVDIAKLILSFDNVNLNVQNGDGETALMVASGNGHDGIVKLLLSVKDIAINAQQTDGATALTLASKYGREAVAKLLLSRRGIAVNTPRDDGRTALMVASRSGAGAVVKLLLSVKDITINAQSTDGKTALMLASRYGRKTVAKLLLSQTEIDVNTQRNDGWTALMVASGYDRHGIVKLLLSVKDIAINAQSTDGKTALMLASRYGRKTVAKLLLSQTEIDVNTQRNDGWTALMVASGYDRHGIVKLLLSVKDIAINAQSTNGKTALMLASKYGNEAVAKLLLSRRNIAVNTRRDDGRTALMVASEYGHDGIVKLLLSVKDITINAQSTDGATALMLASRYGHEAVAQLLLSRGDIAVDTRSDDGRTALMVASEYGHDGIVKLLLSVKDIAINAQQTDGATALTLASKYGREAVAKLLLSRRGIAVNTPRDDGRTALMVASRSGAGAVVKLLLSHPAITVDTQTEDGYTALMLASKKGHTEIVNMLLSHNKQ